MAMFCPPPQHDCVLTQPPRSRKTRVDSPHSSIFAAPSPLRAMDTSGALSAFLCPITHEIMRDPVSTADGHTFEREAIERWLASSSRSPITNLPLPTREVTANYALRKATMEFLSQPPSEANMIPLAELAVSPAVGEPHPVGVRCAAWRGQRVTLLPCDGQRVSVGHCLRYGQLNHLPSIGRFYGTTEDPSSGTVYLVGEDGPTLSEAMDFMHTHGDVVTMGVVLAIAEQVCDALHLLSKAHVSIGALHPDDVQCIALDGSDRAGVQVKIMSWKISHAITAARDCTQTARTERDSIAVFGQFLVELCRIAVPSSSMCACANQLEDSCCDRHIHVPHWPSALLAELASKSATKNRNRALRSCLNCAEPICSRILRPAFVPEIHPPMTFARMHHLLRTTGFDVAVSEALAAWRRLTSDATGTVHVFAVHGYGNDMHVQTIARGTTGDQLKQLSWAPMGSVPTRRRWLALIAHGGTIISLGGRSSTEWYVIILESSVAPQSSPALTQGFPQLNSTTCASSAGRHCHRWARLAARLLLSASAAKFSLQEAIIRQGSFAPPRSLTVPKTGGCL
eukprot:m.146511 g.146511  ORF g.146511 m.146511 type:complete len:568 (+) comp9697_c0_seq25:130-1833(+)